MRATSQSLCCLTPGQVQEHWDRIRVHMEGDEEFQRVFTVEFVLREIEEQRMQLWSVGEEMIIITQVVPQPKGLSFQILWAHGRDLDTYLEIIWEVFHRFAAIAGCVRIELFGRKGWIRKLRCFPAVEYEYTALSCPVKPASKGN